ncbi:hypothetical protein XENTR_v10009966 [Xenopus tropicalis]|nr:hypothetical protein XENTR_v10009966 [Xenopus tropicalis]
METMERMFVMLCCAAAFLLSAVIPVQGSKVLDSLNCFNNYFSLVNCTWTADRPYAHLFNVTLYSSIAEYKPSTPCQSPTQTNLTWTCYFSRSYFYYLLCEEYALLPDRSLEIQLNLTDKDTGLLEHPAPIIYSSEDRYFLLWSEANSALENQTQNISQCESRHKKISEAWEKSSVGECIDSWGVFKPEPGVLHVAKMRVKYINGHWSNWSSEVVLEPKQAEDEAKPQNLRCMHLVGQVLCVWELRVEVADLVAFKLFYKQLNKSDEEECQPTCQAEVPNVPYISCRCSFKMGNLNATSWQISVKPGEEKKPILARDNVLYGPPININVQEKDQGQLYQVRWSTETIEHTLKSHFQICYWREGQHPKNVTFPDCQYELQNKSNNEDRVLGLRLGKELEPLSTYNIKVRMIIKESEKDCPCGPWSEWSKSQTWKTKAGIADCLLGFRLTSTSLVGK